MTWYFFIGLIAAACVAAFTVPQLIRLLKTKDTASIPLAMYVLMFIGDFCFVLDGIGIWVDSGWKAGLPVFLANFIAGVIAGIILGFKLRAMHYSKKFGVSEKQFCENYETYKSKIKMANAEKKANKVKTKADASAEKPITPTAPVEPEQPSIIG